MSGSHWDLGAAFLIGVPVGALVVRDRLARIRLRNSAAVSLLALVAGLLSVFGRRRG